MINYSGQRRTTLPCTAGSASPTGRATTRSSQRTRRRRTKRRRRRRRRGTSVRPYQVKLALFHIFFLAEFTVPLA